MPNIESIKFVDNKVDEIRRGISPNPNFNPDLFMLPISSSTPKKKTVKKNEFDKSTQVKKSDRKRSKPADFKTSETTVISTPDTSIDIDKYDLLGLKDYNVGGRGKKRKSKKRKIRKRKTKKRKTKKRKTRKR